MNAHDAGVIGVDLKRVRQVARVLAGHGFGHILDRLHLARVPGFGLFFRGKPRQGEPPGVLTRARMALEELGPTYVKLGQLIASRPDIVSPEVAREFAGLQDDVPPFAGDEALAVIRREIPDADTLFSSVEAEPAAAASIAQVHFATLADGTHVAVKIRRPGIEQTVETDVGILFFLARMAERHIQEARLWRLTELVGEFSRSIHREMDFIFEAEAIERFARSTLPGSPVVSPVVIRQATTAQVLTMGRFEGGLSVSDPEALRAAGIDPSVTARALVDSFLHQVLISGFFHADPHPGNMTVLPDGRIGMMDFGMTGGLDPELRHSLVNIFMALVDRDARRMSDEYLQMGGLDETTDIDGFTQELKEFVGTYYGLPLERLPIGEILTRTVGLTHRYRIRIPVDIVLLGKAWLTLEGTVRRLDPACNLVELSQPYHRKVLRERYSPKAIAGGLRRLSGDYLSLARTLPRQVRRLASSLARGAFRIDLKHEHLDDLIREMDRSANRLSFSLIIGATIIGSSLIMVTDRGYKLFGYPLLGVVGYLLAGVLGIWLVIGILRSGRL